MKKLLFIPLLLMAFVSSNAQDIKKENHRSKRGSSMQWTPEQKAEIMTKKMTEQLSLTKEQQEKIYELSLKRAKLHAEQAAKKREAAQLRKEESKSNQQQIESLLTTEQKAKWVELKGEKSKLRNRKADSIKREFKSRGGMVKKRDSIQSRKPMERVKPGQE